MRTIDQLRFLFDSENQPGPVQALAESDDRTMPTPQYLRPQAAVARATALPPILGHANIVLDDVVLHGTATVTDPASSPDLLLSLELLTLGSAVPDGVIVEAVRIPWRQIARWVQQDPSVLQRDWRRLEELIAAAYSDDGFDVILTPRSGDRGRDVIAERRGEYSIRILDQVKAYAPGHKVPANDVRAMLGTYTADSRASKVYVTTTSRFAPEVYAEFERFMPTRLDLRDGDQLVEWLTRDRDL